MTTTEVIESTTQGLIPLSRDLRSAAATLSEAEARFLVDFYYQMQKDRIRAENQVRSIGQTTIPCADCEDGQVSPGPFLADCDTCDGTGFKAGEPHELLVWLNTNTKSLENRIKSGLDVYSRSSELGRWARSVTGIGPVIAAGLLAHIDISRAPTAGAIWRFAGLDPSQTWEKKTKRPWNGKLKTLCWKAGESFVKVKGRDSDFYGHKYEERRAYEEAKNEQGDYQGQAEAMLEAKRIGKDSLAYKSYSVWKLPAGQLYSRAKRWAVKLFLAHYFAVGYEIMYDRKPPEPYILSAAPDDVRASHVHYIAPPGWR